MSGKTVRLARVFRPNGRAAVVALDHAQFKGALPGLTPMASIVDRAVAGGADAVILNPGSAKACVNSYAGRCGLIVRVTGASTDHNPDFDYHRQICSIEHAVALGADAVIAMGFVGGVGETTSLELLASLAEACDRAGLPLIAEMLPVDPDHFHDAEWIGLAARAAVELGADVIKAYTTGESVDEAMIRGCGAPFLAAGGPASTNAVDLAVRAMKHGAAGIAFGRNVFAADDPRRTVEELVEAVHGTGQGGGSTT